MVEPPGTRRTRSASVRRRAGKVSLSIKESTSPSDICCNSPSRKPSKIPCLTHALTTQLPPTFSAARIAPRVRAARKLKKVGRASSGLLIVSRVERRSMADFRVESESGIGKLLKKQTAKCEELNCCPYAAHLHSLRIRTPGI